MSLAVCSRVFQTTGRNETNASIEGMSSSEYKQKKGYGAKVPIGSAVVMEMLKEMCVKTTIPPERVVLLGRAAGGCLALNLGLSNYNSINIGAYCCVDT